MSTFALPFEKRVQRVLKKIDAKRNLKNFCKKVWKFRNNAYLCSPVRETVKKFIEKTEEKYKKQVPRKIQFIEKR